MTKVTTDFERWLAYVSECDFCADLVLQEFKKNFTKKVKEIKWQQAQ